MRRRSGRIGVLGGSFDHLHVGHRRLLEAAFDSSQEVRIGLTTDRFLSDHPKPLRRCTQPYSRRYAALTRWLRRKFPRRRWIVVPLSDPWGGSVAPGPDVLFATPDTAPGARSVNRERVRRGLPPVRIVLVPLVLAADGLAVSSRRIRAGLIDAGGRRLRPVRIGVALDFHDDAGERALRRAFGRLALRLDRARPRCGTRGSGDRPGARALRGALRSQAGNEYGLAIVTGPRTGQIALVGRDRPATARFRVADPSDLERQLRRLVHPPRHSD